MGQTLQLRLLLRLHLLWPPSISHPIKLHQQGNNPTSYQHSLSLLDETNAAVEMIKHGACNLDLTGIHLHRVQSAIQHAHRTLPKPSFGSCISASFFSQFAAQYTLFSGSGEGSIVEPLLAVPLNDELQHARALVAKAEEEVLLTLTEKIQVDLDDIEKILNSLDVVGICYFSNLSFRQLVYGQRPEGEKNFSERPCCHSRHRHHHRTATVAAAFERPVVASAAEEPIRTGSDDRAAFVASTITPFLVELHLTDGDATIVSVGRFAAEIE
ncbi:hypothetical protein LWI29_020783 [Acer saccharum]|uniref:Uncharacterized protein n=1 Tax=Acer saccharum TaxID=4024 RepID=A0AA39S7A4_ACESA|nr:hypothetical protein LWI29_020783 [Acer saccharum]